MSLLFRLAVLPRWILISGFIGLVFLVAFLILVGLGKVKLSTLRRGLLVLLTRGKLGQAPAQAPAQVIAQAKGHVDPWSYSQDPSKPSLSPPAGNGHERKPYLIEAVILSDGKNIHLERAESRLRFIWIHEGTKYKVTEADLYKKRFDIFEGIKMKLRGVKAKYMVLFWEGQKEAARIKKGEVNPQVLARVRTSRVLGRALKEMFRGNLMDNKGLIFIIIAFSVIGIVVARVMGYI